MHINLSAILRDWIQRHKLIGPGLLLGSGQLSGAVESPSTTLVEKYSLDLAPIFEPGGNALTLEQEVFDLNEDCPGATLQKRFGLILNIGVLEHIFNVPNALANMSAMVAPNGSIFHVLPCNNWVDHGFYQFSPTLIFDYYAAVDFEVLESALVSFDGDADSDGIWRIRAAQTGAVGSGSGGALDARTYLLVALVRRRNLSKSHAVPVQSRYAKVTARLSGGPRWFPPYDLQSGSRSDYPIRHFIEIKHFERCEGLSWVVHLKDFAKLADHSDAPIRSPLILLEDGVVLGPPHSSHSIVRSRGGGAYSHWCEQIYMSTPDGSDPNSNGRKYVAVIPHSAR